MMGKHKKWLVSLGILSTLVFSGCGREAESATAGNNEDAETVIVGTGNVYQPFVYLDENNELQGYDVEVLKAVDEKLPQYHFQFESMEFKNILTSLSAGKVRLAAHQYAYNEERGAKYLFGEVGYNNYSHHIVNDASQGEAYQTLDELAGKKVFVVPGTEVAAILEAYNQENEDQIELVYTDAAGEILVKGLQNGTADAAVLTQYDTNKYNEQFNVTLQASDETITNDKTFFVYEKGDEELQKAVDGALQELIDEGKLAKLSEEILGADYTK